MPQPEINMKNPRQDIGQAKDSTFSTNLSFDPSIEEMNRVSLVPGGISEVQVAPEEDENDPMFGTHLREAAGTLRKIFGSR
jgi:hypothetical protein